MDVLWSIDSELEDILADAKNAASVAEQGALTAATVAQALKAKEHAEADKSTLVVTVRRLLVRDNCISYATVTEAACFAGDRCD